MEISKGELGSEGAFVLALEAGKIVLTVSHAHASGSVSIVIAEDAGYFIDKLAGLIPGTIDDVVLGMVKEAMKKL